MTKEEYEDLIIQDDVFSEELLDNLINIVNNERVAKALVLVRPHMPFDRMANNGNIRETQVPAPKLKEFPISQPEEGMSKQKYYKLNLAKQEADILLSVIKMAQLTNNKKTTYPPDILRSLSQKWQKYCDSFG